MKSKLILLLMILFPIKLFSEKIPQNFVKINAGTFEMGNITGNYDERMVHKVTVDSFYMQNTEVTIIEFLYFIRSVKDSLIYEKIDNNYMVKAKGNVLFYSPGYYYDDEIDTWYVSSNKSYIWNTVHSKLYKYIPVGYISWYGALEYCNWLSTKNGLTPCYTVYKDDVIWNKGANGYRLPTEAEWEFAAKGKNYNFKYSGSNLIDEVSWYDEITSYNTDNNYELKQNPVRIKNANSNGLFDMSGNMWEWCWDIYGSYSKPDKDNPIGAYSGISRVLRGGAWDSEQEFCSVTNRLSLKPSTLHKSVGFRMALNNQDIEE